MRRANERRGGETGLHLDPVPLTRGVSQCADDEYYAVGTRLMMINACIMPRHYYRRKA